MYLAQCPIDLCFIAFDSGRVLTFQCCREVVQELPGDGTAPDVQDDVDSEETARDKLNLVLSAIRATRFDQK